MRIQALLALLALPLAALPVAASDAIDACRAAHGGDPAAHIGCLEAALRGPVAAPARPAVATGLGAEQVVASQRQADPSADAATVRITSATYNVLELGTFRLDNGQVWRETMKSPAHRRLAPDTEYTARIERGRAGGYRMRVDGIKWMKRVERVE
jgi:hypothetical protein